MGYERKWIDDHPEILDAEFSTTTIVVCMIIFFILLPVLFVVLSV